MNSKFYSSFKKQWTKAFKRSTFRSYSKMGRPNKAKSSKNLQIALYTSGAVIGAIGLSYASVPLYRLYCSVTGYGGTVQKNHDPNKVVTKVVDHHDIRVSFTSQVSDTLPWSFVPVQDSIEVLPGEKALAFFKVKNNSDDALIGMATYNVVPTAAGQYFNKIQCFCFDEQRVNPREEVYMPVHFYVDPEIVNDYAMKHVKEITLSYTFFLSDDQSSEWWEDEKERAESNHAIPVKEYTI